MASIDPVVNTLIEVCLVFDSFSKQANKQSQLLEDADIILEAFKNKYTIEHEHLMYVLNKSTNREQAFTAAVNCLLEHINITALCGQQVSEAISHYLKHKEHLKLKSYRRFENVFASFAGDSGSHSMAQDYPKPLKTKLQKRVKPKLLSKKEESELKELEETMDVKVYCTDQYGQKCHLITTTKNITKISEQLVKKGYTIDKIKSMGIKDYDDLIKEQSVNESFDDIVSDMLGMPRARNTRFKADEDYTPGMKNILKRVEASGISCGKCNFSVPKYPGKYPKYCPECGSPLQNLAKQAANAAVMPNKVVKEEEDRKPGLLEQMGVDDLIKSAQPVPDEIMIARGQL